MVVRWSEERTGTKNRRGFKGNEFPLFWFFFSFSFLNSCVFLFKSYLLFPFIVLSSCLLFGFCIYVGQGLHFGLDSFFIPWTKIHH